MQQIYKQSDTTPHGCTTSFKTEPIVKQGTVTSFAVWIFQHVSSMSFVFLADIVAKMFSCRSNVLLQFYCLVEVHSRLSVVLDTAYTVWNNILSLFFVPIKLVTNHRRKQLTGVTYQHVRLRVGHEKCCFSIFKPKIPLPLFTMFFLRFESYHFYFQDGPIYFFQWFYVGVVNLKEKWLQKSNS